MEILLGVLVIIHMLGWALVLGGALTHLRPPRIARGMTHGALTALVAGVLIVGVAEMSDVDLNYAKITVKLVVALAVAALTLYGARRGDRVTTGLLGTIAGLTTVNIAVAVLW